MNAHEQLKAYLDHELPDAERRTVEAALATSSELREELAQMQRLTDALTGLRDAPTPTGREAALAAVRRAARPAPWFARPGVWRNVSLAGAAALVLVALVRAPLGPGAATKEGFGGAPIPEQVATMDMGSAPMSAAPASGMPESAAAMEAMPADGGMAMRSGPAVAAMPGAGIAAPTLPRQIVRTAQIQVRVPDLMAAVATATAQATGRGGFVAMSSLNRGERQSLATVSMRVPSASFEAALGDLRALGEVVSESTSGEDVTAQVVDVEARLRVMRAEEESLMQILRRTTKIGEVLEVRDRLSRTRAEIESLEGQRRTLRDLAALSSIDVTFVERPTPDEPTADGWAGDAWTSAVNALRIAGRFLGQAAIFLFVFSPLWLVPLAVSVWLARRRR